jgi:hypothetical protein
MLNREGMGTRLSSEKKSFLGQDLVCESEWKKNNQQQKRV